MGYRLKQGVHFCVIRSRVIFLDVLTDRYSGLSHACSSAFLRLTRAQPPEHGDRELLDLLVRKHLLVPAETQVSFSPPPPPPSTDYEDDPERPQSPRGSLRVSAAQIYWSYRLRRSGLAVTLHELQRRREAAATQRRPAVPLDFGGVRSAFQRTRLVFTNTDQCLPRSIAFAATCYGRGLMPDVVLGVRGSPFAAHCWVQSDGRILNDSFDQVRLFTPIFAQ